MRHIVKGELVEVWLLDEKYYSVVPLLAVGQSLSLGGLGGVSGTVPHMS